LDNPECPLSVDSGQLQAQGFAGSMSDSPNLVWDGPEMKRPLSVRFFLNRMYDGGMSKVIAHTDPLLYPTEDPHPAPLSK